MKAAFDRFANRDTNFLPKPIADASGFAVLTTNMRSNIDDALVRRFGSIERFSLPVGVQRCRVWQFVMPRDIRHCEARSAAAIQV